MNAKITIGLIDDHQALTDALSGLLNQQKSHKVNGTAHTFQEGMNLIERNECDVYIIDMNLGQGDSCELIALAKSKNKIPIVL